MCQAGAFKVLSSNNKVILLKMKKLIKISFAIIVALLFVLNVSLNLNGKKVEGLDVTMQTKIASAWNLGDPCYMSQYFQCFPYEIGPQCGVVKKLPNLCQLFE